MKKAGLSLAIAILVFLFIVSIFISIYARAEDGKEYESFLRQRHGLYSLVINYLRYEQKLQKTQVFSFNDSVILFTGDLIFSLFFLLLALFLLVSKKLASIKSLLWFLFAINFSWFIFLLFFRACRDVLDFLIIRLRPDLGSPIIDTFCLILILVSIFVYIWLLARTFHLNFPTSLSVFFVSHICYLLIIFIFFSYVNLGQDRYFNLFKENLGARSIIHSYLSDIKKITSSRDILSFIRIRPYHL